MPGSKEILDMTMREIFSECGIGAEEMPEALADLDGQLSIFNQRVEPRQYVDSMDRVIFAAAIRGRGVWAIFAEDDNGLQMLKLPISSSMIEAQHTLDHHAKKKGWATVPKPESVQEALGLVMESVPTLETIRAWSQVEMVAAAGWAVASHLQGSDNKVSVPHVPNVIFSWVRSLSKAVPPKGGKV